MGHGRFLNLPAAILAQVSKVTPFLLRSNALRGPQDQPSKSEVGLLYITLGLKGLNLAKTDQEIAMIRSFSNSRSDHKAYGVRVLAEK